MNAFVEDNVNMAKIVQFYFDRIEAKKEVMEKGQNADKIVGKHLFKDYSNMRFIPLPNDKILD